MEDRYVEVLLEDIRGKFDLVLEGHAALDRKFDKRCDELIEKVEDNSFKIEVLNKKIDKVDERLGRKIDKVDERLGKKIGEVDERLCKKIDAVEKSLGEKINDLSTDLKAHRADTEAHHGVYRVKES